MKPIGIVRSARRELLDDYWDQIPASIELAPEFGPDALAGLTDFSHAEVIFYFDQVSSSKVVRGTKHPRGNTDWPSVGIFAQRAKDRPNRLGLTIVSILGVEGSVLRISGLDAVDGTPVLDIKPVMAEFLPRGEVRQPGWSHELMKQYW